MKKNVLLRNLKKIYTIGVPHQFIPHGDPIKLYDYVNLSINKIVNKLEEILSLKISKHD